MTRLTWIAGNASCWFVWTVLRPLPLMWKAEMTSWLGLAPHCADFRQYCETLDYFARRTASPTTED